MPSKPSLTKQIADALETEDKREQLERVNALKRIAQSPPIIVTVMLSPSGVKVAPLADVNISVDDAKFVLQKGVDYLTEQALKAKLQQEQKDAEKNIDQRIVEQGLDPADASELQVVDAEPDTP